MAYQETFVQRDQHRIYVQDHPGAEPAIILMHGFPDNVHLYDRLSPYLSPPRRVVLFDFLGWGSSDKPSGYPYTADNQVGDLDAVITQLRLGQVVLVAHDASGPPAIDWALAHPERVAGLVLLNTYYCEMPTLRPPEAIWLFSTPVIRSVARPVSQLFGNWLFRRMYWWQVGRFIRDADVRREFVPLLYQQFDATPSARPAFFRLNEDLLPMVRSRTEMIPKLKEFGIEFDRAVEERQRLVIGWLRKLMKGGHAAQDSVLTRPGKQTCTPTSVPFGSPAIARVKASM